MVLPRFNQKQKVYNSLKDKKIKIVWILVFLLVLAVGLPGSWWIWKRMESTPPVVAIDLQSPAIGAEKTLHLQVRDPQSGLKHVWVGIFSNGKESTLLEKKFSTAGFLKAGLTKSADFDINIQAKALGLKDGAATLRLVAVDHSWQQWGKGNRTYLEKEVVIDTQPPRIEVLSKAHNINPGGAGLVLYKLSEPCRKSGVMVGDTFYSGYEWTVKDSRIMLAFFALSHLQGSNTKIHLAAADNAGNSSRAGFYYHIRNRHFKQDTIRISDRFLAAKLPEFRDEIEDHEASQIDQFLYINRILRDKNQKELQALTAHSDATQYWDGAFLRLPKSANRAGFADHRNYRYQNRNIDDEFHLGVDLASTANSPVPAANKGKVVFAGRIGIYGNIILIDHGFGLFSMYGHLSRMDVEPGQMVDKGSIIGKTGATGLAGGDHLHFAMMVHQTFVNPVEWWDASWIKNNITDKLASIGG